MVDLSKLKKLNIELNDIVTRPTTESIEYMVDGGKCVGFNLFHSDEISIQRAFMEAGTNFPRHSHEEVEWLLQVTGLAKLTKYDNGYVDDEIMLEPSTMIEIPSNVSHSYEAIEPSWLIGITMPGINEYPGG